MINTGYNLTFKTFLKVEAGTEYLMFLSFHYIKKEILKYREKQQFYWVRSGGEEDHIRSDPRAITYQTDFEIR